MIARPALPTVLAALTDLPAETWTRRIFPDGEERLGARRRRVVASDSGVVTMLSPVIYDPPLGSRAAGELLVPWITADPAEAWEILVTAGILDEDPRRTFDVYSHVVDGEIYRAPDGSVFIPGGDAGFEVRAIAEPGADEVQWAIRRGAIGRKVAIPRPMLERGRVVDVMTESLRSIARQWPHPATIPDLVAWASLGADAIVTAEALCREIAPALARIGYGVDRCERVVWRVKDVDRRIRGAIVEHWRKDGDAVLMANGTLDIPGGYAAFHRETIAPVRALWDAGLALERVGAECVLCVPPIGGAT